MQGWDLALLISCLLEEHEFVEKGAGLEQYSVHRQREVCLLLED